MDLNGLIVALGNPGKQYERTRHNFGWLVLDELISLLQRQGVQINPLTAGKAPMRLWKARAGGGEWLLCKPETYMNLSGEAVGALVRFYRMRAEDVFVLHDEVDLPLGRMKLKKGGGTAGHNGLKSIASHLGTQDFLRLRLGIGRPVHGDMADYVLARFQPEEMEILSRVSEFAAAQIREYLQGDFNRVMNAVNAFNLVAGTPGKTSEPARSIAGREMVTDDDR